MAAALLAATALPEPSLPGTALYAQAPAADAIPARTEGIGPFNRVVLRNVTMIDGTGAPAQGPVDIVLSGDRIAEIRTIGAPGKIDPSARAAKGDYELDLTGYYVLPGFVDAHVHLHNLDDAQHVP
jgi:imidazolonepropionase-like amidohydrolase